MWQTPNKLAAALVMSLVVLAFCPIWTTTYTAANIYLRGTRLFPKGKWAPANGAIRITDKAGVVLLEGGVRNGKLTGEVDIRNPDGHLIERDMYSDRGHLIRVIKWYPDGTLAAFYDLLINDDGVPVRHRRYESWYENGQLAESAYYLDGQLIGPVVRWDENGKRTFKSLPAARSGSGYLLPDMLRRRLDVVTPDG